MPYDTESKSRNADFISIAAERQSTTLGAKGPVKLKNPWAEGPSILRTFTPKVCPGAQPRQPSRPSALQELSDFLYRKGIEEPFPDFLNQGDLDHIALDFLVMLHSLIEDIIGHRGADRQGQGLQHILQP